MKLWLLVMFTVGNPVGYTLGAYESYSACQEAGRELLAATTYPEVQRFQCDLVE